MRNYIETYKGYDIYYEDQLEYTVPNTFWIIKHRSHEFWLYGTYTLEEVEKYIDDISYPISPEHCMDITIKSFNDTVTIDDTWRVIT